MKNSYIILSLAVLCLVSSCPDPNPGPSPNPGIEGQSLVHVNQYDITGTGSITYLDNSGTRVTRPMTDVMHTIAYDSGSGETHSRYIVLFENTSFSAMFYLEYSDGTYRVIKPNGSNGFTIALFAEDYPRVIWSYVHNSQMEDDYPVTADENGDITSINITKDLGSGLDMGGLTGGYWDNRNEIVQEIFLDLFFSKSGYIVEDTATTISIRELRYLDTTDVIRNVTFEADLFADPAAYLDDLVAYLVSGTTDAGVQYKRIHDWIADNIYYDFDNYYAGTIYTEDNLPYQLLQNRRGVCAGYARLFHTMCTLADLPCIYVVGDAKTNSYVPGTDPAGHAWNLIRLNNQVYIVDSTWSTPNHYENAVFDEQPYSSRWFLVKPEQSIYSHKTDVDAYQALDDIVSLREFKESPQVLTNISYVSEYFFDNSVEITGGMEDVIPVNDAAKEYTITLPDNKAVCVVPKKREGYDWVDDTASAFLQHVSGTSYNLSVFPAGTGEQFIYLMMQNPLPDVSDDTWRVIAGIRCDSSRGYQGEHPFPLFYPNFHLKKCSLNTPESGELSAGLNYNFDFNVTGTTYGSRIWFYSSESGDFDGYSDLLTQSGENYSGTVTIPDYARVVYTGVDLEDTGSYSFILKYYADGTGVAPAPDRNTEQEPMLVEIPESPVIIDEYPW